MKIILFVFITLAQSLPFWGSGKCGEPGTRTSKSNINKTARLCVDLMNIVKNADIKTEIRLAAHKILSKKCQKKQNKLSHRGIGSKSQDRRSALHRYHFKNAAHSQ